MEHPATAIYDANVLYPAPLRDLFVRLAQAGLVRARWTDAIHDEWVRNVQADNPSLSPERLSRKEPFGQAITYLRNNIEALRVHLDDGLVPIDNNDTEQLMEQVALGRKNWMFIGSIDAGNRAADLMTLVSSAVRNDLDVFLYLKDVLDELLGGSRDFEAMRPGAWQLAHPEAVRIYRQDERRHRAEVKSAKRAKRRAGCL